MEPQWGQPQVASHNATPVGCWAPGRRDPPGGEAAAGWRAGSSGGRGPRRLSRPRQQHGPNSAEPEFQRHPAGVVKPQAEQLEEVVLSPEARTIRHPDPSGAGQHPEGPAPEGDKDGVHVAEHLGVPHWSGDGGQLHGHRQRLSISIAGEREGRQAAPLFVPAEANPRRQVKSKTCGYWPGVRLVLHKIFTVLVPERFQLDRRPCGRLLDSQPPEGHPPRCG
mmetsp:Transcript_30/g.98  ORF Transcript_30/g.98 Transcript_30/m.98 type:complete len:222 (-) Transcript_30:11-676(-)